MQSLSGAKLKYPLLFSVRGISRPAVIDVTRHSKDNGLGRFEKASGEVAVKEKEN